MKQKATKDEQDEIWEEFSYEIRCCIDTSDGSFDLTEFSKLKEDYVVLRKLKKDNNQ